MKKINWKVRFNKDNMTFIFRFLAAVFVPVLVYFGMEVKDLTSWPIVWDILIQSLSNPYILLLAIFNGINVLFDPTTKGLADSKKALEYEEPKK